MTTSRFSLTRNENKKNVDGSCEHQAFKFNLPKGKEIEEYYFN